MKTTRRDVHLPPRHRRPPIEPQSTATPAIPLLIAHGALIAISVLAFGFIVGRAAPGWVDPGLWAAAYDIGMAWTGPLYIVSGFLAASVAWIHYVGTRPGILSIGVVLLLATGAELLGTTTGFPFGAYGYGSTLGPKVMNEVPIVIPLSWFLMLYASLAVAARMRTGRLQTAGIAALGLVAWDVLMDPAMSAAFPFWSWHEGGEYYGMPLVNWFGWLLTGLVLAAPTVWLVGDRLKRLEKDPVGPALYALNGLFPFALALQAGMWGAALIGGAVMLLFFVSPRFRSLSAGTVVVGVRA